MGVVHPQLPSPAVHLLHESPLTSRQVLRHGAGAVVGRGHGNGLEHIPCRHGLTHLQVDLTAALGGGGLRGGNGVIQGKLPGIHRLHNEQHGHDLGNAGGGQLFVGITFIQHRSRSCVHENGALSRYLQPCCPGRMGQQRERKQQRQKNTGCPFHIGSPLQLWFTSSVCPCGAKMPGQDPPERNRKASGKKP